MTTAASVEDITAESMRAARRAIEYYFEDEATDGLPVVPPIQEFVDEFLATTRRDPDEVISSQEHLHRTLTVRQAAINAVMAGCKPEYFPVLLTAIEALDGAPSWRGGLLQSTTGQAQLILVNGPVRNQLGFNYQQGVYGPGFRPNATIGRAVRMIIMNVFGIRPGELDQGCQGSSSRYTFCIAENEEDSPWEPFHVEKGLSPEESAVSTTFARGLLHVEQRHSQEPRTILSSIGDTMAYGGGVDPGHGLEVHPPGNGGGIAVIGPEHANLIAAKGWSKKDAKECLWEVYGRTVGELRRAGKPWGLDGRPDDEFIRFGRSPDAINIIVAGGYNCGISSVIMGAGLTTKAIPSS